MRTRIALQLVAASLAITIACAGCGSTAKTDPTTTRPTTAAAVKPTKSKWNAGYSTVPPGGDLAFTASFVVPPVSCLSDNDQDEGILPDIGAQFKHKGKYVDVDALFTLECNDGPQSPELDLYDNGRTLHTRYILGPDTGDHVTITVTGTPEMSRITYRDLTNPQHATLSGPGGTPTFVFAQVDVDATGNPPTFYPVLKFGKITFKVSLDGKTLAVGHGLEATDLTSPAGKVEVTTGPLTGGTAFTAKQQ